MKSIKKIKGHANVKKITKTQSKHIKGGAAYGDSIIVDIDEI